MRFVLAVGSTETATIDGISAAGASPESTFQTPSADAEIVEFGRPVRASTIPVSPTGCPTPAVVTRAVRECVGFSTLVIDAGLAASTAAPTVSVETEPGSDIRESVAVKSAQTVFESGRALAERLPDTDFTIGESIPGGTTTALGVLSALGAPYSVSSSHRQNPIELKREVVAAGLKASGLERGDAAHDPVRALRSMGDPVLSFVSGFTIGALQTGARVRLAGGSQMIAAGALVRHAGFDGPIEIATTPFVVNDDSADVRSAAEELNLDLVVTDPEFDGSNHPAMQRYLEGEAKEGVGMGGALALAAEAGIPMARVRESLETVYHSLLEDSDHGS